MEAVVPVQGVALPPVAPMAVGMQVAEVAGVGPGERPEVAARLAVEGPRRLAVRQPEAVRPAVEEPQPQVVWQPGAAEEAAEPKSQAVRQRAEAAQAEAAEAAEAVLQGAAVLPEAWPPPPEAVWAADRSASRTPKGRRS